MTLASAAFGFGQPLRPNLMFLAGVLALGRVLWWIRTLHIEIRRPRDNFLHAGFLSPPVSDRATFWSASTALPKPCSRHANFTICSCLLAQGWQSTSIVSILNKRSCCWMLQLRPRSDFGRLMLLVPEPLAGARARRVLARRVLRL